MNLWRRWLADGEYDASGNLIREYIYLNGQPIAQIESNDAITYLHTDHLGTPRIASDSIGVSVWSWDSDAFGNEPPSGTATVNLRMAGQYYDSESALFYNWNRYYNSSTGRYISSDPIGLTGGLNTFAYTAANPVMYVDPEGLTYVDTAGGMSYGSSSYGPRDVAEWCRLNPMLCIRYGGAAGIAGIYLGCVGSVAQTIGESLNNSAPDANEKGDNAKGEEGGEGTSQAAAGAPMPDPGDDDREYSNHAKERMKERDISKQRVEEAIKNGRPKAGNTSGTTAYDLPSRNSASGRGIRVVVDNKTGRVITVIDKGTKYL